MESDNERPARMSVGRLTDILQSSMEELEGDVYDKLSCAIGICIVEQYQTKKEIVNLFQLLNFKKKHISSLLNLQTGDDPNIHWWNLYYDGKYYRH